LDAGSKETGSSSLEGNMARKIPTSLFLLLLAILSSSGVGWGQATTSLRGTITDTSGAIVPHAKVTLTNTSTNQERETTTTDKGLYELTSVLPGNYQVTVEAKGFSKG